MSSFVKSHALGNDYIVFKEEDLSFPLSLKNIQRICDRHVGIGSDGILVKTKTQKADFGLKIYNPDGSEAMKSGNGLRIFSLYLFQHHQAPTNFSVETLGGIVQVRLKVDGKKVQEIRIEMGQAQAKPLQNLKVENQNFSVVEVNIGNPHCVIFDQGSAKEMVLKWGPCVEVLPQFPDRTNVQFVEVLSKSKIRIGIWERGAGLTMASGSSSCAAAYACYSRGLVGEEVQVEMPGGNLKILISSSGEIQMIGNAEEIYQGKLNADLMAAFKA